MKNKMWTEKEIEFLKENYPKYGSKYCSEILKRKRNNILTKCHNLKIKFQYKSNNINLIDLTNKNVLYVWGFLWADGYLSSNSINLDIKRLDSENVYYNFKKTGDWEIKYTESFLKQTEKYYQGSSISALNKENSCFLKSLDFENKSYNSPTKLLSQIPIELQHHFFRGYFDGDGSFSIYNNDKTVNFNVTSTIQQDWSFIVELFTKLKIETYNSWKYDRKSGKSSNMSISNKWDIIKLGEYLYQDSEDLRLERKFQKYQQIKNCDIQKSYPNWTDEEINFLKENYSLLGAKCCSEKLNKSIGSIYGQAFDLKINRSNNKQKKWSDKNILYLKNNYLVLGAKTCSEKLNKKIFDVYDMASNLNLTKKYKK